MLPTELRLHIYSHVLRHHKVRLVARRQLYIQRERQLRVQMSLARICRTIREEILLEIYAHLTFESTCDDIADQSPSILHRDIGQPEYFTPGRHVQNAAFRVVSRGNSTAGTISTLARVVRSLNDAELGSVCI